MSSTLGLSLALDSTAVSQYAALPFTSFLTIGGKVYGTTPDGLYLIEGDTAAMWQVSLPMTDAGATQYKRVRSITVSGPNTANVEASVLYDSGQEPTIGGQQPGGRFYVGRDGAGRAFQITLAGTGPAEMTSITADVMLLGNKARG